MKHHRGWGLRGLLLAAASGTVFFASAAQAQGAGAPASAADLRRQLQELAQNPGSVSELVATGRAALAVGDGEAALGFFARAHQLSARDARVKAGLAAANAHTGRPETALALFSEAVSLGAPEAEIAGDRGLAYDLVGQNARAQQDYVRSLRHREDPEIRRRMALSLAITGQPEAALRLIDEQVRRGDRAGNRAKVMVLALSGDVRGATDAANATLPPAAARSITPFFSRLASLSPGQMASAANLGRVPSASRGMQMASSPNRTADPGALAFAGGGSTASPALAGRLPVAPAPSTEARRRPGAIEVAARSSAPATRPRPAPRQRRVAASSRAASASPRSPLEAARVGGWSPPATISASTNAAVTAASATAILQPHPHQPLRLPGGAVPASAVGGPTAQEPVELAGADDQPRVPQAVLPPAATAEPALAGASSMSPADGASANLAAWNGVAGSPAVAAQDRPEFADVVASVSALPAERPAASSPPASPQRTASAAPATTRTPSPRTTPARATQSNAAARTAAATRSPAQLHPSRVWVQLGVSPSRTGFGYEIGRMRRAAPELFRNRQPHVAPIGSSHRLLVGPFPTSAAAQTFINSLKAKDIPALPWTSPAGTQVDRFAAGR